MRRAFKEALYRFADPFRKDKANLSMNSELMRESELLGQTSARLDAGASLIENLELLSKKATIAVIQRYPEAKDYSEFFFDSIDEARKSYKNIRHQEKIQGSLDEDINVLLKLVAYSLVLGNTSPMQKAFDKVLKLMSYKEDSVPPDIRYWYIEALGYLRKNHGLIGEAASEANAFIDFATSCCEKLYSGRIHKWG